MDLAPEPSADPVAAPRKQPRDTRRQQLIEATIATLAHCGYARMTLAEVTRRAGLSQGLVNFHFDSKERLLTETLLYLAEDGKLAGILAIEDPLRPEAAGVVETLRGMGFKRVLMLTGDDERTARAVAERAGITEFRAQVLPTDKAKAKSVKCQRQSNTAA